MNKVRTIVTGTVVGLSTLWAGVRGTQYLGQQLQDATTKMIEGVVDVAIKEVVTPIAANAIGEVVQDVGGKILEERMKRELGYYVLKDMFEKVDKESAEDREAQKVFEEIMKQRAQADKENKSEEK